MDNMALIGLLDDNEFCAAVQNNSKKDALRRYRQLKNCGVWESTTEMLPHWDELRMAAFAPNV